MTVYLEPGEAVALNAGYMVTEVMDIVHNDMDILILDVFSSLPYAGCPGNAISSAPVRWIRGKSENRIPIGFLDLLRHGRCDW